MIIHQPIFLTSLIPCTNAIQFQNFNKTCVLLFCFGMLLDDLFCKEKQTKNICLFIASRIKYHMTCISTNNKCLKPGISAKFDWLQKALLTQTRCHVTLHLQVVSMSYPTSDTLLWFPIGHQVQRLYPSPLIGHWDTWLIINSPLLIIIPGIHSLTCLMMTRSLII